MARILVLASVVALVTPSAVAQEEVGEELAPEAVEVEASDEGEAPATARPEASVRAESGPGAVPARTGHRVGRMPALWGHTGMFHLFSADGAPTRTFTLGLFGEFFKANDVVRVNDENTRFGGRLTTSYGVHDNVELFASLSGSGNVSNFAEPELIQSQGDILFGAKGFAQVAEGISAGGAATIVLLNGQNSVGVDFGATSLDLRGLFTYDLDQSRGLPLLLHFNLGLYVDNSAELFDVEIQRVERFAHNVSDFNRIFLGLGAEFPVKYVTPFLEWNFGIPVGSGDERECATNPIPCPSDAGGGSYPNVLTLGIRGTPASRLALNLGMDIGLTSEEATGIPAVPPYNLLFGVSYNLDPWATEREAEAYEPEPTGWILGEVVDDETGEPIEGAVITYPGRDLTAQSTDPASGRFRSYEFEPETEVAVDVSHPRYDSRAFTRIIQEGQDGIRIRLRPSQNVSLLAGRVTGPGGVPVPANVYLTGPEVVEFEADPLTAEFERELPIGRYVITVAAEDHLSYHEPVELTPGEVELSISLEARPPEQMAVLWGDRIELVETRITFVDNGSELTMESEGLLDQVAEILRRYEDISLNIVAHGDDSATIEFTEEQARSVREYLADVGIDPARLTVEGAGGTRPLFPNINDRYRSRNWRVELEIPE